MNTFIDTSIKPALRARISHLISAGDVMESTTELRVWQWVRNELNAKDVQEIAAVYLMDSYRNVKRVAARSTERKFVSPFDAPRMVEPPVKHIDTRTHNEKLVDAGYPTWDMDEYGPLGEYTTTIEGKQWVKETRLNDVLSNAKSAAKKYRNREAESKERWAKIRQDMKQATEAIMDEARSKVIVEWTEELLSSTFTVDGTSVAWSEATKDQHERRSEWLVSHATGTLETAVMHSKAIEAITEAGVNKLGEIE